MQSNANLLLLTLIPIAFMLGCGSDVGNVNANSVLDGHDENPNEVMTTLKLTFTPADGGESFVVTWADPEHDGNPIIDDITLNNGQSYTVKFDVLNELEEPTEDVTPEITDEMDEHQIFYTGSAVEGPCNTANPVAVLGHVYEDLDNNGLPIGLSNTVTARTTGAGILSVLLRHMPLVDGSVLKTAGLAAVMDTDGSTPLPGSTDIKVDFNVTVE